MNAKKMNQEKLYEIESLLGTYLQPVSPRPEFVSQLKKRLLDTTRPRVQIPGKKYMDYWLIALASVIGSALFLVTGVRAILTVMSALGIIHFFKNQTKENNMPTPGAAI